MNIAETVIQSLGRQAVAQACQVNISQTYRWEYPRARGGTGGKIPARHFHAILTLAKEKNVTVDPWDLIGAHEKKPPRSA